MSEALHFASHRLQEFALLFMAIVYILRLRWIMKFPAGKERQAPSGTRGSLKPTRSILYSWFNVAQPWAMESTRTKLFLYFQFVIFHVGVVAAIGLSFIIPYGPGLLQTAAVVRTIQVLCFAAFLVAVLRVVRRFGSKHMRAISTPDDHFSLFLLMVWFLFAGLAAPNNYAAGESILMIYFWMTAFFLVYVPFSKISHYLYYPFTRYYLGKTLGRRGVFPIVRG
jgi:nitrate reductase gamma subunit